MHQKSNGTSLKHQPLCSSPASLRNTPLLELRKSNLIGECGLYPDADLLITFGAAFTALLILTLFLVLSFLYCNRITKNCSGGKKGQSSKLYSASSGSSSDSASGYCRGHHYTLDEPFCTINPSGNEVNFSLQ